MTRAFSGLRRREPRSSYDAVIVGAGIGGLVLANLLAKEGLSVLLTEQHYMVGGYCSTFRRAGYTFDAATHFYPLLGNPETVTGRLLAELGVETGWVRMDPVDTFHFPDGSRFEVPADFDRYRARLDAELPELAGALDRFFTEVREAYLLGLLEYFKNRRVARLDPIRGRTLRQALDHHFPGDDPASRKVKLLLTADCPHWGSAPRHTSFVFDSMLRLSYFLGNYYPEGGYVRVTVGAALASQLHLYPDRSMLLHAYRASVDSPCAAGDCHDDVAAAHDVVLGLVLLVVPGIRPPWSASDHSGQARTATPAWRSSSPTDQRPSLAASGAQRSVFRLLRDVACRGRSDTRVDVALRG